MIVKKLYIFYIYLFIYVVEEGGSQTQLTFDGNLGL